MPPDAHVDLQADQLADGWTLPDCCCLHGLPAARKANVVVRSRPRIAPRRAVLLPGYASLNRADEYLRQVRTLPVAGWPLCASCVRRHSIGLAASGLLFFGGLLAMVVAFAVGAVTTAPRPWLMAPILGGFAAALASVLPFRWGSLPSLTGAALTDDGTAVRVTRPHPTFREQVDRSGGETVSP